MPALTWIALAGLGAAMGLGLAQPPATPPADTGTPAPQAAKPDSTRTDARSARTASDMAALTEGVRTLGVSGNPGTIAVWGEHAFPVVVGKTGNQVRAAVVAAAKAGNGRIVGFSHSGYADGPTMTKADTGRLLLNAVRWASGKPGRKPPMVVAVGASADEYLRGHGLDAKPAGPEWHAALAGVDCVLLGTPEITEAQAEALKRHLAGGGGLVAAQTGWGWQQLSGGKPMTVNALNRLVSAWGLAWTDQIADATASDGFAVGPIDPTVHAATGLAEVIARPTLADGVDAGAIVQAVDSVVMAARHLPKNDRLLRPKLSRLLDEHARELVPTQAWPITTKQPLRRMLVAHQLTELASLPAAQIKAHPAASEFPGAPAPGAKALQGVIVTVDTKQPGWQCTGLYAAPGQTIIIEMPEDYERAGLWLRIGAHTDTLWHLDQWRRMPEVSLRVPLVSAKGSAASAFGGIIYVDVPENCRLPTVELKVSGGVEMPHFVLGRTTNEEWKRLRGKPGPWAELSSRKIAVTVPSAVVRELEDPAELMRFWDSVADAAADLATIPRERRRPERYVADLQISAGYMHSGYPIMTHLDAAPDMVAVSRLRAGTWGLYHELGHNHQSDDWTFDGTGEVTVNLFTMYILEKACGKEWIRGHDGMSNRAPRIARFVERGRSFDEWKSDPFLALQMYAQLVEAFGWETYRKVFAEYRGLPASDRPKNDDQKRDQWMERFSRAAGKNLGPFFDAWGVPVSRAAKERIADLPAWMPADMPADMKAK